MPNLNDLDSFLQLNIGHFVTGRWDYIGLAQLYPEIEFIAQVVPRKTPATNKESTIIYQPRTEPTEKRAKPGDPVQPTNQATAIRRKVGLVKTVDSRGWTLDQDSLLGKEGEHLAKQLQLELVDFDLHFWQEREHDLLRLPDTLTGDDDEPPFGIPAWVTDGAGVSDPGFDEHGGDDPYPQGRPGGISVADEPFYTNAVAVFDTVSDDDLFDKLERFAKRRKLMGIVPNPRLVPDTPADVIYTNLNIRNACQRYLTASNENVGMDTGRYRGDPLYKNVPIHVWHAADSPDSPVRDNTGILRWLDWNTFEFGVQPEFDRKITGPDPLPLVPSGRYITSELWYQITNQRPDRNLFARTASPSLQP